MSRSRRLKVVPVSLSVMADLVRPRCHGKRVLIIAVDPTCPELDEAELLGVSHSYETDCFLLFFSHPNWPEVPLGEHPPMIQAQVWIELPNANGVQQWEQDASRDPS